jgi:ribonuclease VapC
VIVLDSSAILAVILNEPGCEVIEDASEGFAISTVNMAEVVTKLVDFGFDEKNIPDAVDTFRLWCRPLTERQAHQAGLFRKQSRRFGLSLGDRCCLALARDLGATVYTTDRVWADLDVGVAIKVVR